jgi:hypothetical protein
MPATPIRERTRRLADRAATATPPPTKASKTPPRSLVLARAGIRTGYDTINMLMATITDVLEEEITTNQANVVVNSIGKVLKTVELQQKYGRPKRGAAEGHERDLILVGAVASADAEPA